MHTRNLFLIFVLSIFSILCNAQIIKDKATLDNLYTSLSRQKQLAAGRTHQLFDILNRPMKPDERMAIEYLYAYLPLSDLADYTGDYFVEQVRKTLQARNEMPWGTKIPEDIFLHFVLPVRVNNENLDNFRVEMYDELKHRISGMSMHDAALEVNHWCHEKVTYKGSDERTSSPLATIKTSFGRCGEESTFTVSALRAVGIPARQVYTPRWAHCDDNHAWVEVWVDGKWYFLGACEPEPELNMGWFAGPAMRAMLVHTRAFGWYNGHQEVIDRQEKFSELNLISNYAETKKIVVKVTDPAGNPAQNALVEFQLYNYAEFYPIAKRKTDANGMSSITTGLGDLLVWATRDGNWNYKKITVETTDTLRLQLLTTHPVNQSEIFDLVPPIEKTASLVQVSPEKRDANTLKLQLEDSIRMNYMQSFKDSAWSVALAMKLNLDPVRTSDFIEQSCGNWQEISGFLESAKPESREWALNLLGVIASKDLRDTKKDILLDHLENSLATAIPVQLHDTDLFSNYILSGRILNEMMLPWRGFLQQQFTGEFIASARNTIQVLVNWIKENVVLDDLSNLHSRAPLSPRGVFELKVADSRSRDIFFVALCRCFSIPARINPATYMPQYWKDGTWVNITFDPVKDDLQKKGYIHFTNANAAIDPKYAINFTIAKFKDGVYRTVDFDFEKKLSEFPSQQEVETGDYYLVTGNRQADGSVLSSLFFFSVQEAKTTEVRVNVRENFTPLKALAQLDPRNYQLEKYTSGPALPLKSVAEKGAILIWLDPDKEPSKHVMADIPSVNSVLEKWKGSIVFVLQKDKVSKSFNPGNYNNLPADSYFAFDPNNKLINELAKLKGRNVNEALPVIVILRPSGELIYFSEGYKIGIGEQLAKIVMRME